MVPINGVPLMQIILEQLETLGFDSYHIIINPDDKITKAHFEKDSTKIRKLRAKGKNEQADQVEAIASIGKKIKYHYQIGFGGDGDAVLQILDKIEIGDGGVFILFPDNLALCVDNIKNIVTVFNKHKIPAIGVKKVPVKETSKYGIIAFDNNAIIQESSYDIMTITSFVEKPDPEDAPSTFASIGYTILTKNVLNLLRKAKSTCKDGELRVADALTQHSLQGHKLYGVDIGVCVDCGTPLGWQIAGALSILEGKNKTEFLSAINCFQLPDIGKSQKPKNPSDISLLEIMKI